jgi:PilZ domain
MTLEGSQQFLKACWAIQEPPEAFKKSRKEMAPRTQKRETRKSLQQPGWITFEGGFAARQCLVQDLSTTGAKVTIDDPNALPARLRLALTRDARTGRNCEVVWRRGNSVGVKFVR